MHLLVIVKVCKSKPKTRFIKKNTIEEDEENEDDEEDEEELISITLNEVKFEHDMIITRSLNII